MLPTSKQAEQVSMQPGARFSGIRFHPAIGYGILGKHYEQPTLLEPSDDTVFRLYEVYALMKEEIDINKHIDLLYKWAMRYLDFTNVIPNSLENALQYIQRDRPLCFVHEAAEISQRQVERICKIWLGMTPKHYQRILRIKHAIEYLRMNKNVSLVDVANEFGFSDQAHMTREFKHIACMTPKQIMNN